MSDTPKIERWKEDALRMIAEIELASEQSKAFIWKAMRRPVSEVFAGRTRILKVLDNLRIETVGDLTQCDAETLVFQRNFSKKSLEEVRQALWSFGFDLKKRAPHPGGDCQQGHPRPTNAEMGRNTT